ncbi:MAG: TIGR02996 domain-containing protein, partial [Kofleriaceae bacterium]
MASLLVYVEPTRLAEILDVTRRDSGEIWRIGRLELVNARGERLAELDRLDDDAMLFLATTDAGVPRLFGWAEDPDFATDGQFAGADVRLRDHDLADVLGRLGCTTDLAQFAAPPRVLPPGDIDLMRYVLALADDAARPPPPPEPIVADDAELIALRDAVYADPAADEPRLIYADALQSRGDPRGELIALQVARAADQRHVPTQRERVLVARIADACAGPLAPCLDGFVLARGFVVRCTTKPGTRASEHLARHAAWATVDELYTTDRNVLWNRHLRARRLGIHGEEMTLLARAPYELPYEMIGGFVHLAHRGTRYAQTGVLYNPLEWANYMQSTAFARLRAFSVDVRTLPHGRLDLLLANQVGRALEHLDIYIAQRTDHLEELAATFEHVVLPRLTLRAPIGGETVLALERD